MDFNSLRAQRKAELMQALQKRNRLDQPIESDKSWKNLADKAGELYNKKSDMTEKREVAESQEMDAESEDSKRGKFIKAIKGRKQEVMMA